MNIFVLRGADLLKASQGVCQPGISRGVARGQLDRLFEVLNTFGESIFRESVVVIPTLEVSVVRTGVDRTGARQAFLLLWGNLGLHFAGNRPSDLILQIQDVTQISLVVSGPELLSGGGANEGGCDSHPVAGTKHRTRHYGLHVQPPGNLR